MATTSELSILISSRDQASATLKAVQGALANVGHAVTAPTRAIAGLNDALGKIGLAALGIDGIVRAAQGLAGALASPISAASDLNETLSKSQAVFGDSSAEVEAFAKTAAQALGQSRQQALEAAATFGNLFTSIGLSRPAAAGLSTDVVKLASDLASFNNIDPGEALEKLRSGLVGESEPLRALGINLTEAAVAQEALRLGLAETAGDVSEAAKVQARYSLIMAQSKNAVGDFAKTSTGMANAQRIIAAGFKDIQVEIGSRLLPVIAPLISSFATGLPKAIDAARPALDALGALVSGPVSDGIKSLIGALSGTWQPAPGIGQFADLAGRAGLIAAGVRDTVITLIGALSGTWQPGPGIGLAQEAAGRLGLLLKDVVIPAVQTGIGLVQQFAGDPLGALGTAFAAAQSAMEPFAPTADRIGKAVGAIAAGVALLIPEPLGAFVAGLVGAASSADGATKATGLLADAFSTAAVATNAVSGAIEAGVTATLAFARATGEAATSVLIASRALSENKGVMFAASVVTGALAAATGLVAINYGLAAAASLPATAASIARAAASAAETAAIYGLILADNIAAVATGAFTAAQWLLNAALTANPIGIVVVALGALAGGLIYAYNNIEPFRQAVDAAWAAVQSGWATLTELDRRLRESVDGAITSARAALVGFATDAISFGSNVVTGIIQGIGGAAGRLFDALRALASDALAVAKAALGIRSPSRVMAEQVGAPIVEGIAAGIRSASGETQSALADVLAALQGVPLPDLTLLPEINAGDLVQQLHDALGGVTGPTSGIGSVIDLSSILDGGTLDDLAPAVQAASDLSDAYQAIGTIDLPKIVDLNADQVTALSAQAATLVQQSNTYTEIGNTQLGLVTQAINWRSELNGVLSRAEAIRDALRQARRAEAGLGTGGGTGGGDASAPSSAAVGPVVGQQTNSITINAQGASADQIARQLPASLATLTRQRITSGTV